jgi:hypothetical protein
LCFFLCFPSLFLLFPCVCFCLLALLKKTNNNKYNLQVGCLHPVACTRSGSGFPSNATLVWIFYSLTATCFGLMTIYIYIYIFTRRKMVIRPKHVAVTE